MYQKNSSKINKLYKYGSGARGALPKHLQTGTAMLCWKYSPMASDLVSAFILPGPTAILDFAMDGGAPDGGEPKP